MSLHNRVFPLIDLAVTLTAQYAFFLSLFFFFVVWWSAAVPFSRGAPNLCRSSGYRPWGLCKHPRLSIFARTLKSITKMRMWWIFFSIVRSPISSGSLGNDANERAQTIRAKQVRALAQCPPVPVKSNRLLRTLRDTVSENAGFFAFNFERVGIKI